jgi:ankyrin repeat protein
MGVDRVVAGNVGQLKGREMAMIIEKKDYATNRHGYSLVLIGRMVFLAVLTGLLIASLLYAAPSGNEKSGNDSKVVPSTGDLKAGDLYAVVVGISKYQDKNINKIDSATTDAEDFAKFLKDQKKVFNEQHVRLLTDDEATKMEIDILLQSWLGKAKESDTIVIFLSGHGEPDLHSSNAFYFLPWDVRPQYLAQTAVRMSGFLNRVHEYKAKRVLLIADSCHSGGFLSEMSGPQAKSQGAKAVALTRFMEEMDASSGVAALFSSKPDQISWHLPPMRNSVFTHFLLKGLRGKADENRDGMVTFYEAYQYAWRLTKQRTNGKQEPYGRAPGIVGSFPIAVTEGHDLEGDSEKLLLLAAKSGNLNMVMGLLEDRVYINSRDNMTNDTPLILAARNGRTETVEFLIKKGAKVNDVNNHGDSALIAAAEHGHLDAVKLLLEGDAAVNRQNSEGEKALTLAARQGHLTVVEKLLEAGANIRARNNHGSTALILAARFGRDPVVRLLLRKNAEVNVEDKKHRTALSLAARFGHPAIVRLLLDAGAKVSFAKAESSNASPPEDKELLRMALKGDPEKTRHLLEKGATLGARTRAGDEPLTLAAGLGHVEVVKKLLDSGADVNKKASYESTPLKWAAMNGFSDSVELLLDRGAEVNVKDKGGATPLMYAAQNGHFDIVKVLCDRAANVNLRSTSGNTALILASEFGRTRTVAYLLKLGAQVDAASSSGRTCLMLAAENGHARIVDMLLEKGGDVLKTDDQGLDALMLASGNGHGRVVAALIAKGAKIDAQDGDGSTALMLAVKNNRAEVAKLLLDSGATAVVEDREGQTALDLAKSAGTEMAKLFKTDGG